MSRLPSALAGLLLCCSAFAGAARAQNAESELDRRVLERLATQKATTDLRDKRCVLGQADASEIVVCAPRDPDKDRYPGREQLDSVQSTRDGIPRAPDFVPKYPGVVVARGCFIPPCAPPPMIFIDVKALPQAPAGSDADLIAKGEIAQP
ncbi:MAG: hypothetical protein Q8Q73_11380 [Stagnimonas sp.]|nr:hypothetical protein [Stagnimonas sp.]